MAYQVENKWRANKSLGDKRLTKMFNTEQEAKDWEKDIHIDLPRHSKTHPHAVFAFAYWKLLQLQVVLPSCFISVSQVLELL